METAQQARPDATLIETLRREARRCPSCGLEVRHPFVELCPRCTSKLPAAETDCPGCMHRVSCPVARMH